MVRVPTSTIPLELRVLERLAVDRRCVRADEPHPLLEERAGALREPGGVSSSAI